MTSKDKYAWLISPKSFVALIGAEYKLLKQSGSKAIVKFYVASVTIVLIFLLSFLSIMYAMELLFHLLYVELLFSLFFSLLFVFIYIFLLNTFSKSLHKKVSVVQAKWGLSLSNLIRAGFVAFMAFLIAQPTAAYLKRTQLDQLVSAHQRAMLDSYAATLQSLQHQDVVRINTAIAKYESQLTLYPLPALQEAVSKMQAELASLHRVRQRNIDKAILKIASSDFFLYRVSIMSRLPVVWFISLLFILLFLLPGWLIYSVSKDDAYYRLKKEQEEAQITRAFQAFEKWYVDIFYQRFQLRLRYYSVFEDPPFNQVRKAKPSYQSQHDFLLKFTDELK